ncbi:DUF4145 domain-containing protein [Amycolatopsis sp. NPDC051903]|uniref:DUF4145 domain-containing protein n=1 Tax=Amycolatopsis sp. NPDC051903 TaxID=3363936 RepID=UPI0037AE5305
MTAEIEDRSPRFELDAFECPYCHVYATQEWADLEKWGSTKEARFWTWKWSECRHCHSVALWSHDQKLVWPDRSKFGPSPNPDMPKEVRKLYEEARAVFPISPRSSGALLRLALQVLIDTLEPGKKTINEKIRRLVARGLEPTTKKAMDVLRVVGNNAVHPGEIELDGDDDLIPALFALLNLVVHHVLSRPKQVDSLFDSLPESARTAIERRDSTNVVSIEKPTGSTAPKNATDENSVGA